MNGLISSTLFYNLGGGLKIGWGDKIFMRGAVRSGVVPPPKTTPVHTPAFHIYDKF